MRAIIRRTGTNVTNGSATALVQADGEVVVFEGEDLATS